MQQYKTQYGTIFAVKEHNGAPAIMCRAELSETWSLSSMIEPFTPGAWTADELQGQLDSWAATKGWAPVDEPASAEPPEIVDEGSGPEDGFPDWVRPMVEAFLQFDFVRELPAFTTAAFKTSESVRHHSGGSLADGVYDTGPKGIKFSVFRGLNSDQYREASYTWAGFVRRCRAAGLEPGLREKEEPPRPRPGDVYRSPKSGQLYKIGELTNGKKTCYLTMRSNAQGGTWVPVNSSVYPKLSDAQGEFEAWIRTERLEPVAPTGAAAATTDASAVPEPPRAAETLNASPAKEGDASSSRSAEPAPQAPAASPLSAPDTAPMSLPAFDYTCLDAQTVQDLHLAEREFAGGKRMAEIGLRRMADGVAIAHDALCGTDATLCRNGDGTFTAPEKTFGRWCDSVGLNRKAAERLLQVSKLFDNSSPRQQKALEELGPTLLYAAAKPSAPAELVQAVKDGDITTHKQYQDLLAQYDAEKAARAKAEKAAKAMTECYNTAHKNEEFTLKNMKKAKDERDTALRRAAEAEKQRDGARDALAAAKLRGDKLKAENDALKAQPVEAQVVDEEEVNRRAQARADELTAPLREELEALRARHPADLEEAEQAIRDAYDSAIYTGRVIENAWRTLRPLLPRMDAHRRELAIQQVSKTLAQIQGEITACL